MTHLTIDQLIDSMDSPNASDQATTLSAPVATHLAICRACAAQLEELRGAAEAASLAGAVPEPSPLFWPQLSARVQQAVADEPPPGGWFSRVWRPALAVAFSVIVVGVVTWQTVAPHRRDVGAPAVVSATTASGMTTESDTAIISPEAASIIDAMTPPGRPLRLDEVKAAGLAPSRAATEAAIADLTPAQREELVRLIRAELGDSE